MKALRKLKSTIKRHASIRSEAERLIELHAKILLNEISEQKRKQLQESYDSAKTTDEKLDVLAKHILNIEFQINGLAWNSILSQQKRNAWKTPLVLLLWATFFPLYITTAENVWLILLVCAVGIYLLITSIEIWKSKKIADTCLDLLVEKFLNSQKIKKSDT